MGGSDLFTGTLDILVLRAVALGPLHGYAIGQWIRRQSDQVLAVEEGALYPALHRLERRGLVASVWGRTETGRRARFYGLTAAGRRACGRRPPAGRVSRPPSMPCWIPARSEPCAA
jgi:PadR family transcriptional regulator PadR